MMWVYLFPRILLSSFVLLLLVCVAIDITEQ